MYENVFKKSIFKYIKECEYERDKNNTFKSSILISLLDGLLALKFFSISVTKFEVEE